MERENKDKDNHNQEKSHVRYSYSFPDYQAVKTKSEQPSFTMPPDTFTRISYRIRSLEDIRKILDCGVG
jgi:hypothetical protein